MKRSRRSLPYGSPLGDNYGCQLGKLTAYKRPRFYWRPTGNDKNCGKPDVRVVAGIRLCAECSALLDAIVADAVRDGTIGERRSSRRKPLTSRYLRVA